MLTAEQIESYNRDGYLVIPNFSTPEEVADLQHSGVDLVSTFDPQSISVFSTKNQTKKTDQYFLDSANDVGYFFEEGAFDSDGNLIKPKELALNKLGHALHDLIPTFRSWTHSPKIKEILRDLHYVRPLPVQSMFIFKQPGIGGEVVPHQDSSFLTTEPPSVIGLWLALEDATLQNGCLWVLPGSQTQGIHKRFIRDQEGAVSFRGTMPDYSLDSFVPVEVKAGSLVLLHGANVHCSKENLSGVSRHAFSIHVVEGKKGVEWSKENWLQRKKEFPFEPIYVDE